MTDYRTARLLLHPIDAAEAERIVARRPEPTDSWAADFPFDGDLAALGAYLRATAELGEQRPFGYYRIVRSADGQAIGGVGFKGRPDAGRVEIGYGLAPSARGHGYAAEALGVLLDVAREHSLSTVVADTTADNAASQRTLLRAGFRLVGSDEKLHYYEARVQGSNRPAGDHG